MEGGFNGAALRKIGGIEMPSFIDVPLENKLNFTAVDLLLFKTPFNRRNDLSHQNRVNKDKYSN
jgi:hypothetical protein